MDTRVVCIDVLGRPVLLDFGSFTIKSDRKGRRGRPLDSQFECVLMCLCKFWLAFVRSVGRLAER